MSFDSHVQTSNVFGFQLTFSRHIVSQYRGEREQRAHLRGLGCTTCAGIGGSARQRSTLAILGLAMVIVGGDLQAEIAIDVIRIPAA